MGEGLGQTGHSRTHVVLVRVVSLLEGEDRGMYNAALLLQCVGFGGKGQDGLIIGGKTGEPQLGKIMDEEVEFGGHTAQTGLYQPGVRHEAEQENMRDTFLFLTNVNVLFWL